MPQPNRTIGYHGYTSLEWNGCFHSLCSAPSYQCFLSQGKFKVALRLPEVRRCSNITPYHRIGGHTPSSSSSLPPCQITSVFFGERAAAVSGSLIEGLPRILWLCCAASPEQQPEVMALAGAGTQSSSGHKPELDKLYCWHLEFLSSLSFLFSSSSSSFFPPRFDWGLTHSVQYPSS